jgi:hypothetical protein
MDRPPLRACPHCQQAIEVDGRGRLVWHWLVAWTGQGVRLQRRRCPYRGKGLPYPHPPSGRR